MEPQVTACAECASAATEENCVCGVVGRGLPENAQQSTRYGHVERVAVFRAVQRYVCDARADVQQHRIGIDVSLP
jgi:hypothetical protein